MVGIVALFKVALPLLAASALAGVTYPPIPEDLTTPVQQRLAVYGPNGEKSFNNPPIFREQLLKAPQLYLSVGIRMRS